MKFASALLHRSFKFVLPGVALAGLAAGTYFTRSENSHLLAAPASPASMDVVDQSALTTARRLAAQAHGADEREQAAQAVEVADHAVDQAFETALREAADATPPKGEALATLQKIAGLEMTVEEEKEHVVALNMARLKTASQIDVADLGERAQTQLEVDTEKLRELHRDLILLESDEQARIQQARDEHDALQEQAVVNSTSENDLESSQKLVTLPGKVRAFFEMRAREKQLRQASEDATTAATRMTQQKEASDARTQDQQQLAAIYSSWADLTKAKRVTLQHGILLALAILVGIFLAASFGVALIRRELAEGVKERRSRYPMIAGLAVEALALVMILIVIFGTPGRMPASLGL